MKSDLPKVSVVMPVYNGEEYLSKAIESVLGQTFKNFEFIIVNDGSRDNSIDIINRYAAADSRIKVISRENRGLIASLNEGIEKSSGKYIARMDADDICLPIRFDLQVRYLEENNIDICGGDYLIIDKNGNIISDIVVPFKEEMLIAMASGVPFAHPSVMMRKSIFDKNISYGDNGYHNAEDLALWFKLYNENFSFGNVAEKILKYRDLDLSVSKTNHKGIRKDSESIFNSFINLHIKELEEYFSNVSSGKILHSRGMEKRLVIVLIRYLIQSKKFGIFFRTIIRNKLSSIALGCLSYLKYKLR